MAIKKVQYIRKPPLSTRMQAMREEARKMIAAKPKAATNASSKKGTGKKP